jgi:type II secretory pathway predicted ATPase ExeA/tetratricopeptide (TPR) repeat protein
MYESYFGFREWPFSLFPDANFLYLSKKHKIALAKLRYGLESQALITVVTGNIGCGKTTLGRKFMDDVAGHVTVGLITNFHNSFGDMLQWVLMAFDLDFHRPSNADRCDTLSQFLKKEYAHNRRALLIIDEAQNMDGGTLEELRMLSNIVVDKHQFLQLVLVGQPEFRKMLQRPELSQFAQRISVDYHLYPLDVEETGGYIKHRLLTAGGDPEIFFAETYPLIHQHSNGVPRLINVLCETALIYAHGTNRNTVDSKMIQAVIEHRKGGIYLDDSDYDSTQHLGMLTRPVVGGGLDMYSQIPVSPETEDSPAEEVSTARDWSPASAASHGAKASAGPMDEAPRAGETLRTVDAITMEGADSPKADGDADTMARAGEQPLATTSKSPGHWVTTALASVLALAVSIGVLHTYTRTLTELESESELLSGWLSEARGYMQSLLEVWPGDTVLRSRLERVSEARARVELADQVELWMGEYRRYLLLGQLLEPLGSNAREVLQRVLKRMPEHEGALAGLEALRDGLYERALELQGAGDWAGARGYLGSLLELEPGSERVRAVLMELTESELLSGWLSEARGYEETGRLSGLDGEDALGLYQRVLGRRGGDEAALAGLERVKVRLLVLVDEAVAGRRWGEARGYMQSLLEVWPGDAVLRSRLERVSGAQARVELADQVEAADPNEIQSILSGQKSETPVIEQPVLKQELLDILKSPN